MTPRWSSGPCAKWQSWSSPSSRAGGPGAAGDRTPCARPGLPGNPGIDGRPSRDALRRRPARAAPSACPGGEAALQECLAAPRVLEQRLRLVDAGEAAPLVPAQGGVVPVQDIEKSGPDPG